ncbi:hypothetical protein BB558_004632 [Smittium angustum]|uniref:GH16 domain-containing protein n=1 Tax=Smittium angustum TaxID=133377 RepID=A0A2U1J2R9_SMIAN|nr:hypothetical protein BB558_004632 [Smittium angustum]
MKIFIILYCIALSLDIVCGIVLPFKKGINYGIEETNTTDTKDVAPKCKSNKKVCSENMYDFSDPSAVDNFNIDYCEKNVVQDSNSLKLLISEECGTTLIYPKEIVYGKVEGRIKMAPGSGAVTAIILIGSGQEDEIDFEWVGKDLDNVQSMYFIDGKPVESEPGYHQASDGQSDMSKNYHNYGIELTKNAVNWYIDGNIVRTLKKTSEHEFPSKANKLRFGVWNGSNTSGWAGKMNDFSSEVAGYFEWVKITEYC